jgi:hypothetical protein
MRAKIGFAILLGLIYATIGVGASFGITSIHLWSGLLMFLGMVIILPFGILSIWRFRLAGRLLVADAILVACSGLFQVDSKEEAGAVLVVAFPILMSGLLFLKKPETDL